MSRQTRSLTGQVVLVTNIAHFVGLPPSVALADQGAVVVCHDSSFIRAYPVDAYTR